MTRIVTICAVYPATSYWRIAGTAPAQTIPELTWLGGVGPMDIMAVIPIVRLDRVTVPGIIGMTRAGITGSHR